jgi:hypothetical protein
MLFCTLAGAILAGLLSGHENAQRPVTAFELVGAAIALAAIAAWLRYAFLSLAQTACSFALIEVIFIGAVFFQTDFSIGDFLRDWIARDRIWYWLWEIQRLYNILTGWLVGTIIGHIARKQL